MSLWIRSQDKELLINCHAIEIDLGDGKCICSNGYVLGTYSTKEKALKVLDMIETHIEKTVIEYRISSRELVFDMPLDSEVNIN